MTYLANRGIRSNAWEHQILYDVLEPHGREYSPELSPSAREEYLIRLCKRVFDRLGVSSSSHAPAEHAGRIWELIGPTSLELYSEVVDALQGLRAAGYRLAIVSNWQCGLGHYCDEMGIGQYFDDVVASAEIRHAKPDGAIFAEAASRLGLAAHQILHVGDSVEDDWNGARAAGMHAALLVRDGGRPPLGAEVLRALDGISSLLEKWRGSRPA
jgi:HAD superfamily hydrolase (TIGR01549 family)